MPDSSTSPMKVEGWYKYGRRMYDRRIEEEIVHYKPPYTVSESK